MALVSVPPSRAGTALLVAYPLSRGDTVLFRTPRSPARPSGAVQVSGKSQDVRPRKRGERADECEGHPARTRTSQDPADLPRPALGGPGPLSVYFALRGAVHLVFYPADFLCALSKLVPV